MITRRELVARAGATAASPTGSSIERDAGDRARRRAARHCGAPSVARAGSVTVHHDAPRGPRQRACLDRRRRGRRPRRSSTRRSRSRSHRSGPAWISRPLAAPARVELEDPTLAEREPLEVAAEIVQAGSTRRRECDRARASNGRARAGHRASRGGLRTEWPRRTSASTPWSSAATAQSRACAERRASCAEPRRSTQRSAAAATDLELLANAGRTGRRAVRARARSRCAAARDGLGVWAAFVTQADAVVERQGLTRYRVRTPIAPGAEQLRRAADDRRATARSTSACARRRSATTATRCAGSRSSSAASPSGSA